MAWGYKKHFASAITLWLEAIRNMFALFPLFRSEATQNFRAHFSAFSLHQNPDQILAVIPFLFSFLITRFRHTFYAVSLYTLQIQCTTNAVLPAATQASVLWPLGFHDCHDSESESLLSKYKFTRKFALILIKYKIYLFSCFTAGAPFPEPKTHQV